MPEATLYVGCGGGSDRDSRLFWFIPIGGWGTAQLFCLVVRRGTSCLPREMETAGVILRMWLFADN